MAAVEVIATYELYNVNRIKLENVIHRVFDPAQLDIEINDRFGNSVRPRESAKLLILRLSSTLNQ